MAWDVWTGGDYGDWATGTNWSTGAPPNLGDYVYTTNGQIVANGVDTTGDYIILNTLSGTRATLTLNNGNLGANSTTILEGHSSVLDLHNSTLQGTTFDPWGNAAIVVASGTSSTNTGGIGVASWTPSTMQIVADGLFTNNGWINAGGNGTMTMAFRSDYMTNNGNIQADPGGNVNIVSLSASVGREGIVQNQSTIRAIGGTASVYADLQQSTVGSAYVDGNGTLILGGKTDGGVIVIQSGMLGFAPSDFTPGPFAASHFNSTLELTGPSAAIGFYGDTSIAEEFRAATNDILVTAPYHGGTVQIADIHLGGSVNYSASDFSVQGNMILYNSHFGATS